MQKDTVQRRVIRTVLEQAERPLLPLDILARAQTQIRRLGIATVYRTLKGLQEEGLLVSVSVAGSPPHFELAHKPHHHHFKCEGCDTIFDVNECVIGRKKLKRLSEQLGLYISSHDIVLFGLCPECRPPGAAPAIAADLGEDDDEEE